MDNLTKQINILSIEAWRYDGSWTWNAWYKRGTAPLSVCKLTPRRLLKYLRNEEGALSDASKGRVKVVDDGYNIVIEDKNTGEPLIALEYGATL